MDGPQKSDRLSSLNPFLSTRTREGLFTNIKKRKVYCFFFTDCNFFVAYQGRFVSAQKQEGVIWIQGSSICIFYQKIGPSNEPQTYKLVL